jgi:hypothetical protein
VNATEDVDDATCAARWATSNRAHLAGDICGAVATELIGDVDLCVHHYRRALDWFYKHTEDAPERHEEARRKAAEKGRLLAEARSVVYYLRRESDGLIKIGFTSNYRVRLSSLRREHGPLRLLLATAGARGEESAAHKMFLTQWVAGEWFRPEIELLKWIEDQREIARYHQDTRLPVQAPLTEVRALLRSARAARRAERVSSRPA